MKPFSMYVRTYKIKSQDIDMIVNTAYSDEGTEEYFYDLFVDGECINEGDPVFIDAKSLSEACQECPTEAWVKEFYGEVIDEIAASKG